MMATNVNGALIELCNAQPNLLGMSTESTRFHRAQKSNALCKEIERQAFKINTFVKR